MAFAKCILCIRLLHVLQTLVPKYCAKTFPGAQQTYDTYKYISTHTDSGDIHHAGVGLAQARPNYYYV